MSGRIQVDPDYYQRFGLPEFASAEDVRRAYRRMALQHHPDRGGDAEMMKKINHIYEVLTKHKDEYDMMLRQARTPRRTVVFEYTFYTNTSTTTGAGWSFTGGIW